MPLSEPLKEGKVVLNQEKKDKKISKILFILTSFFSWFKTKNPVHPYILFFLVQDNTVLPFLVQSQILHCCSSKI